MPVLLDCRWLGKGGVGKVTELLLQAWRSEPPSGRWLLWGPPSVEEYRWPQAEISIAGLGRAPGCRSLPPHTGALFLHQLHQVTGRPSVTFIHDTIPVRYGGTRLVRRSKRIYLAHVASRASHIITGSTYSRDCIQTDLGIDPDKISVINPPLDRCWVQEVRNKRERAQPGNFGLYVGRFAGHKNLLRLLEGFSKSIFCKEGGILILVGGEAKHISELMDAACRLNLTQSVVIYGVVDSKDLCHLYSHARFVVSPAVEEGYGLPAHEALALGVPLVTSTGGALAEIVPYANAAFDPFKVDEIAQALDRASLETGPQGTYESAPSGEMFGRSVAAICDGVLHDRD